MPKITESVLIESSALPFGSATSGLQTSGNSSLSAIAISIASVDTKTPALGQAAMAASTPVVIASNQSALPVTGTFFQGTQPVSLSALPALVAGSAIIGKVVIDQTTPGTTNGVQIVAAIPAGTNAIGKLAANSGVTIGAVEIAASQTVGLAAGSAVIGHVINDAGPAIIGKVGIDQTTPGTTNGVQINAALPAGTNVIGHVIVDSAPTTAVTGPLTDTQLRASAVPMSLAALPSLVAGSAIIGKVGIDQTTPGTTNAVEITESTTFRGRAATFNTPGRAGTAGQKILALFNTTGSGRTVYVEKVVVDVESTVIKAVTVPAPIIRLWMFTSVQTNGTALTKNKTGGTGASSASVVVHGDASADGTGSGTTLTVTLPAGMILTQEYAARMITAAGYEMADRVEFMGSGESPVALAEGEGVCVFLSYTLATQNPTTDTWIAAIAWSEK